MYTEKELQSQKDKAQEISSIFGELLLHSFATAFVMFKDSVI